MRVCPSVGLSVGGSVDLSVVAVVVVVVLLLLLLVVVGVVVVVVVVVVEVEVEVQAAAVGEEEWEAAAFFLRTCCASGCSTSPQTVELLRSLPCLADLVTQLPNVQLGQG